MKYSFKRAFLWLFIFLILATLPLLLALVGDTPSFRSFWMEFGVALGFIGLALFGLQFIFSGRIEKIAPTFGMDNILQFHKNIGIVSFVFVLAHPITLIIYDNQFLSYFDPNVNFLRAIALSFASVALFAITASSLWRIVFKLTYEQWRLLHGFLAASLVFIGVVHSIQVGHYLEPLWKKIVLALLLAPALYMIVHTRFVRPYLNKKKPYKVIDVKEERDDCWTIQVKAINHKPMTYQSGQFAWLTINDSPFSLQQHPFSIASAEDEEFISFTAKASGDFTSTWKNISPGTAVYLEGPFGSFTSIPGKNLFLVMGGIGVTPAMSMLRTMKAKNDQRKATLIYGTNDWENTAFREELLNLEKELNLELVFLLMEPPTDWQGESGKVDEKLLEKYLPKNHEDYVFYICGPGPLMDITEIALRDLDVDWRSIYSERFEIV